VRIGIDFGTTRIVVASVDRGNFPLVHFEAPDGQSYDWFPPVAAVKGDARLYGWEAVAAQDDENWSILRSLKRSLRSAGPHTELEVAGQKLPLRLLITEMMASLRKQLLERSNLGADRSEQLEAMLGVPANANSNQRFLTEEAAQKAGFTVLGLMNEPSAAAIEFAYRNSAERKSRAGSGLLVYDLGGGTFDVSAVTLGDVEHTVDASDGIPTLGGDDFDDILADLALEVAGEHEALTPFERRHLIEECREKKESLNPNTRKVTIDLERARAGWEQVTIPVDLYYERCRPLIEATRKVVEDLLAARSPRPLDTLYVTGGGSEFPPVARILRESFGRKVRRSAYMRSASAVGLAIRAGTASEGLRDQFNENFGIWRETDHGGTIVFDLIFPRGARLPAPGEPPMLSERNYHPVHNIGHFRYLECSQLDEHGQPTGEITNWGQILFPFDPELRPHSDLISLPVCRLACEDELSICEEYTCDASGNIRVKISARPAGYEKEFSISTVGGTVAELGCL
jgi:molecular chaperone DnaK (HSP70)